MRSILKRILGVPDDEPVTEEQEQERYSARVVLQQEKVNEPRSAVHLVDQDTGYDPYDTGRFGAGRS